MSRVATLLSLVVFACTVGLAGEALAQFTTTISNTTNGCIDSTFKSYSPNQASPSYILIDRRLNVNPVVVCNTVNSNSAACNRDSMGPGFLLAASATAAQLGNSPSCSWDCGACGTIITDGGSGLPVELMEFSVEGEQAASPGEGATDDGGDATDDEVR